MRIPSLGAALLVVAGLTSAACGSVCGDLEDVCARCADPTLKVSCDASVAVGEEDYCSEDIGTYEALGCK